MSRPYGTYASIPREVSAIKFTGNNWGEVIFWFNDACRTLHTNVSLIVDQHRKCFTYRESSISGELERDIHPGEWLVIDGPDVHVLPEESFIRQFEKVV